MKKIYAVLLGLVLFFGASCLESSGQTVSATDASSATSGILYRAGNVWADGVRLKKPELKMMFSEQDYGRFISGRRLMVSGATLTGIGGAFVVVNGAFLAYFASMPPKDPFYTVNVSQIICAGNVILGGAMLVAGVPCLCVGINRMQKTVRHHNETQLTLGPTSSGFGLALKF